MVQKTPMQSTSYYPGDDRFGALLDSAAANLSEAEFKRQVHKIMETTADPADAVDFLLSHLDARKCPQETATRIVAAALGLWNDLARERNRQRINNRFQ